MCSLLTRLSAQLLNCCLLKKKKKVAQLPKKVHIGYRATVFKKPIYRAGQNAGRWEPYVQHAGFSSNRCSMSILQTLPKLFKVPLGKLCEETPALARHKTHHHPSTPQLQQLRRLHEHALSRRTRSSGATCNECSQMGPEWPQ